MYKLALNSLFIAVMLSISVRAQETANIQIAAPVPDKGVAQSTPIPTASTTYNKWWTETLANFAQGLLTPHYAVAVVAQRLDDNTAQVELLLVAEMKNYIVTIQPVTLTKQASGEYTTTGNGRSIILDQKAGPKLDQGPVLSSLGTTTTIIPVSRAVQALEITWAPKNNKADDPVNTCLIPLSKEPTVIVNGYILGTPIR